MLSPFATRVWNSQAPWALCGAEHRSSRALGKFFWESRQQLSLRRFDWQPIYSQEVTGHLSKSFVTLQFVTNPLFHPFRCEPSSDLRIFLYRLLFRGSFFTSYLFHFLTEQCKSYQTRTAFAVGGEDTCARKTCLGYWEADRAFLGFFQI